MPNQRKKKAAKMEDFKKKRLKVGKKKATPDNFTDTSFKSKSISLPNQSISEDKSHEVTTSRNLTLTDLVTQLKHYNSRVKKEALAGLTDLCNSHPDLLIASLGSVVNGILKLFISEDREVRKATLAFLQETFIDIDLVELQPFMPLLIIYTCSAMTHIFEDVRLDAVKLMDLWIQIAPDVLVTKFWNRVIGNYMSLLAVDSNKISTNNAESGIKGIATTTNVKAAATKSHLHIHKNKLGLFTSLSKFLGAGLADEQSHSEFWFLLNYLENRHARQAFKEKMASYDTVDTSKTVTWDIKHQNAFIVPHSMVASIATCLSEGSKLATFSHLHLFESSGPKNTSATTALNPNSTDVNTSEFSKEDRLGNIKDLIETFQPILVASWLEAAPNVFVSTNTISMTPALELLHEILHLSLVLWRAMVESNTISTLPKKWLKTHLESLLKHLTVYFPYGADSFGNRGSKVDDMLQDMNIMLCELTSLYLLARTIQKNTQSTTPRQTKRRKVEAEEEQEDVVPEWAEVVVGHVLGVLGVDANGNAVPTNTSFRAENLVSLLPAIWGFLNCLSYEESILLFKSTLQYHKMCQPNSASKRVLLDFITRVYMVQSTPSYNGQFCINRESELANILQTWASNLPENFLTKRMALSGNL